MLKMVQRLFAGRRVIQYEPGNPINLLIELDSFDKGGLQKVVLDTVLMLDALKFRPVIVSIGKVGYLAKIATQNGIKVYSLNVKNKYKLYEKIIIEERINLSCSHYSNFGYRILKSYNIPNITFIHNVYAFLSKQAVDDFKNNDKYIDRYISVSKNATRYANEKFGISLEKIITIPNGLIIKEHLEREKKIRPISREEFNLFPEDYVFLNVASYNLHKGHYLMIDAMKTIIKVRQDIKIICIGNIIYPPHVKELTEYLKSSGLDKYILMPGYFSDVESFYAIADAFILPSFIEGWSIAMNEAMFYKKPMILTDTGGAAEVIENNDIGILIENEYGDIINLDSRNLDEMAYNRKEYRIAKILAKAMLDFADNKEFWMQAGKEGRDKILKFYNFNNIVKMYENIFINLLESNSKEIK